MIPQFDLKKEFASIEKEIRLELDNVFSKANYVGGENVNLIEKNIAKYIGVKYAVSCNSGTDALHFALESLKKKGIAYKPSGANLCKKPPAIHSSPKGPDNFLVTASYPKISFPNIN